MSKLSIKHKKEAFELLETYVGNNPYIKMIKNDVIIKKSRVPNDFELAYVLKNHDFKPVKIDKIVKIVEWFGLKKQEQWQYPHKINKLQVTYLLGETETAIHCYVNYKHNQEKPVMCFIPKNCLLDTLLDTIDEFTNIDYNKYDDILEKHERKVLEIQKQTCEFILNKKRCIIANEPGSGKTLASILAILEGDFKKALIISPATLKTNWRDEILLIDDKPEEIDIVDGTTWVDNKKYTIVNYDIIDNFHIVPKTKNKDGKEIKSRKKTDIDECLKTSKLLNSNFDIVIIDEAHMLSNYKSIRSEAINDFIERCDSKYLILMTGTPISNNISMFFSILKLLKHSVTDNYEEYMTHYSNAFKICKKGEKEYWTDQYLISKKKKTWFDLNIQEREDLKDFIDKNAKKILVPGKTPINLDELYERIKDCYLRLEKKDVGNISEKYIIENYYELTEEERGEYNMLWSDYEIAENEKGNNNLNQDLTELILFRNYVADKMVDKTIEFVDSLLTKNLKVFLVTTFTSELDRFVEYYGDAAVYYKGGMTTKKRDLAVKMFNEDENIKIFIGNTIASNMGLSLHKKCHTAVISSLLYSASVFSQVIDRVHRLGSQEDVQIYVQMFKDTISEDIWSTVIKKDLISKALIKSENVKKLEK